MKTQHINFCQYYSKLDKDSFTTVRWTDKYYRVGRVYDIVLTNLGLGLPLYYYEQTLFQAKCVKIELKRINQFTEEFVRSDADCSIDEFFKMMKSWYKQKPDWKDINSEMQVLYLEKQKG